MVKPILGRLCDVGGCTLLDAIHVDQLAGCFRFYGFANQQSMNDSLKQVALQLRQHIHQFVALSDQEWSGLEPHLSIVHLKKHQFMATQGVVANQVAFVLEVVFRQFYPKDGQDRTTYFFFDQQLIAA